MTREKQEVKECKCICKSKWFRKFIVVTLGTFTGGFLALSLFAALHKPPMPPCPYKNMTRPPFEHKQHFRNDKNMNFKKDVPPVNFKRPDRPHPETQGPIQ